MRDLPLGVDQRSPVRHPDFLGRRRPAAQDRGAARGDRLPGADLRQARRLPRLRRRQDGGQVRRGRDRDRRHRGRDRGLARVPARPHRHAHAGRGRSRRATALDRRSARTARSSSSIAGGIRNGVDVAKALALGADCVYIGTAALIALNCNAPLYEEDYATLGTAPGACHHCHTGRCPVGVTTQDPGLMARLDVDAGGGARRQLPERDDDGDARCSRGACGKSDVHNLEPEDLRALTLEAAAFTGVPLVGRIDRH